MVLIYCAISLILTMVVSATGRIFYQQLLKLIFFSSIGVQRGRSEIVFFFRRTKEHTLALAMWHSFPTTNFFPPDSLLKIREINPCSPCYMLTYHFSLLFEIFFPPITEPVFSRFWWDLVVLGGIERYCWIRYVVLSPFTFFAAEGWTSLRFFYVCFRWYFFNKTGPVSIPLLYVSRWPRTRRFLPTAVPRAAQEDASPLESPLRASKFPKVMRVHVVNTLFYNTITILLS